MNYIKQFLVLASAVTGFISISTFAFLLGVPIKITSSAIGLKIFATAAGLKGISPLSRKRRRNVIK